MTQHERERAWPEWQGEGTAPRDGTQFLGLLPNGWYSLLRADPTWKTYAWWTVPGNASVVPIVETHAMVSENSLRLTHWLPLPQTLDRA